MACSTTGLLIALLLIFVFTIFSTIIAILVPSLILVSPTASSTTTANNKTAQGFCYGAGAIGVIIIILLFVALYNSWITVDVNSIISIRAAFFGWGTLALSFLLFILLLGQMFLLAYAISFIDTSTSTSTSSSGKWWAIAGAVFAGIALIALFVSWFMIISFNQCLNYLPIMKTVSGEQALLNPETIPLGSAFTLVRNKNETRNFVGRVTLKGYLINPKENIMINGFVRENMAAQTKQLVEEDYDVSDKIDEKKSNDKKESKDEVDNDTFGRIKARLQKENL